MYTLQIREGRYRWLYTTPNKIFASGISSYLELYPTRCGISYHSMQKAHEAYPQFRTILTTDNPSSLPETHPELFI